MTIFLAPTAGLAVLFFAVLALSRADWVWGSQILARLDDLNDAGLDRLIKFLRRLGRLAHISRVAPAHYIGGHRARS